MEMWRHLLSILCGGIFYFEDTSSPSKPAIYNDPIISMQSSFKSSSDWVYWRCSMLNIYMDGRGQLHVLSFLSICTVRTRKTFSIWELHEPKKFTWSLKIGTNPYQLIHCWLASLWISFIIHSTLYCVLSLAITIYYCYITTTVCTFANHILRRERLLFYGICNICKLRSGIERQSFQPNRVLIIRSDALIQNMY